MGSRKGRVRVVIVGIEYSVGEGKNGRESKGSDGSVEEGELGEVGEG